MSEKSNSDVLHQHCLQLLCRICGKENENALRAKESLSALILKAMALDVNKDDPSVHPPKVCDVCRMKMTRFKKNLERVRKTTRHEMPDAPDLNITVFNFQPHCSPCAICKESTVDLKKLSDMGVGRGFLPTMTMDSLTLTKLSTCAKYVLCWATINSNGSCAVAVGSRNVTQHHLKSESDYSSLMNILQRTICVGNLGFEDVIESRRTNEIFVVFRDSNNVTEIAREEQGSTIRHVNCFGFVAGEGEQCDTCFRFRSSLRKMRSRVKERTSDEYSGECSVYTRNDYLSEEQKNRKLSALQEQKLSLRRQLKVTQSRLKALIEDESKPVTEDLHNDLTQIASSQHFEEGSLQQIFWQQQEQHLNRHKCGRRWHPAMVRYCIGLYAKSPGAYETLRSSGVLTLPSSRTLRDYTFFTKPSAGLNPDTMERITKESKLDSLPDWKKDVIFAFDEIKICQGLVYAAETDELVGWVDVGDMGNILQQATQEDKRMPLATHIMCLMIRGLFIALNQVFAFFPTNGCSADELFYLVWEAVMFVELYGFRVRALTCDGAAANRKFFRLGLISDTDIHWAPNPVKSIKQKVYYFSDTPHLIKTTRNNWENSGWNSKSKDLRYNDEPISWVQLVHLVQENQPLARRRLQGNCTEPVSILQTPGSYRLTPQHIYLTPSLRMKVKLAAQVLSDSVRLAFSLSPNLNEKTKSTQYFIAMFDQFFDCLNVQRKGHDILKKKPALAAYEDVNDWRFQWLTQDFLGFLSDWEHQSMSQTDLPKKERARLCISRETLEGLRITVASFVELSKLLLSEGGNKYILSARFNQDPLEQYFSKQRSLSGFRENPDVRSFGYNHLRLVVSGSTSVRAATHGNTTGEEIGDLVMEPLAKRRKCKPAKTATQATANQS